MTIASEDTLLVFARALRPGRVKTRLIGDFGETGALDIYRQLLMGTLALARTFPGQVELWLDAPDPSLETLAREQGWVCCLQQGDNLGDRMTFAMARALAHAQRVLLVGSDCPVLTPAYLEQALDALQRRPVVFGASEDGGYVLLGSSQAALWNAERFAGVRWSTAQTLQDSLACFSAQHTQVLPPLWDVDTAQDVARARATGLL